MSKTTLPKSKRRCIFCQKAAKRDRFCTACGAMLPEVGKSMALASAVQTYRGMADDPRTDPAQRAKLRRFLVELKTLTTETARSTVDAARKPAATSVTKSQRSPRLTKASGSATPGVPGTDPLAARVLRDYQEMTHSADPKERELAWAVLGSGALNGGAR